MRPIVLALLLSACGYPVRIDGFTVPPAHNDVLWIYIDGLLRRCTAVEGRPVCVRALMIEPLPVDGPQEKPAPPSRPKVKPKHELEAPTIE